MDKLDGKTVDLVQRNIDEIKKLFPEAVSEGKIDFDRLRLLLGDEVDTGKEKYEFTWPGKSDCIRLAQQQSTGTLRPDKESSKDWDTTKNLYIEGDNLEVLRLLQKAYHRKVKMIYIDPPYNTGNDFIYKDDFKDNVKNFKEKTEQAMKANPSMAGRYHSDWLNMMYPRLRLARNLLTDNGVIFISIDDHEAENLKKICNEIFGESNFIGEIIRKTKSMTGDNGNGFNLQHENLYIYAKNKFNVYLSGKEKEFQNYSNPDNDSLGEWCSGDPSAKSGGDSTYFPITNPFTNRVDYPPKGRYWAFSENSLKKYIEKGKIKFKTDYNESERGFIFKRYKNEAKNKNNPVNSLFATDNEFMNQSATTEFKEIVDNSYFSYPKPTAFLVELVKCCATNKADIILDFFSGSATTAHAVIELNKQDGGARKFIMVQLPEACDENSEAYKAGFSNICEIGKERIRRAGEKIKEENQDKEGIENLDIGFKVFKLDTSNLKAWDPDVEELEETLKGMVDPIKEDRTQEDMLYEIMLKYGIDLTMPLEEIQIAGKTAYSVGLGYMIVCLEDGLTLDFIEAIGDMKQSGQEIARVVFRDSGFADDNVKTNAVQLLKKYGIKDFRTI
ncbi:MAG: site-specific DNA-methyltransferase [Syntrophomonas sp.]|uniref:site-specific DNA-methyltransferase n=1 Tax=Syntrophomonas sp. TaxID=2053627 RepID=UPI00262D2326|nr:site-specific DNA-methyltransferase [Syntrophomonas sp.]MDD4626925.1 site-specific DNA-methyltransferase [Syntrophomonas sp.]